MFLKHSYIAYCLLGRVTLFCCHIIILPISYNCFYLKSNLFEAINSTRNFFQFISPSCIFLEFYCYPILVILLKVVAFYRAYGWVIFLNRACHPLLFHILGFYISFCLFICLFYVREYMYCLLFCIASSTKNKRI